MRKNNKRNKSKKILKTAATGAVMGAAAIYADGNFVMEAYAEEVAETAAAEEVTAEVQQVAAEQAAAPAASQFDAPTSEAATGSETPAPVTEAAAASAQGAMLNNAGEDGNTTETVNASQSDSWSNVESVSNVNKSEAEKTQSEVVSASDVNSSSDSTSYEQAQSEHESDLTSDSQSYSDVTATSQEGSTAASESYEKVTSASASNSSSTGSVSDEVEKASQTNSVSAAASESTVDSKSTSQSDSDSASYSDVESISGVNSESDSTSYSEVTSKSTENSVSDSTSYSEFESESASASQLESTEISNSQSYSAVVAATPALQALDEIATAKENLANNNTTENQKAVAVAIIKYEVISDYGTPATDVTWDEQLQAYKATYINGSVYNTVYYKYTVDGEDVKVSEQTVEYQCTDAKETIINSNKSGGTKISGTSGVYEHVNKLSTDNVTTANSTVQSYVDGSGKIYTITFGNNTYTYDTSNGTTSSNLTTVYLDGNNNYVFEATDGSTFKLAADGSLLDYEKKEAQSGSLYDGSGKTPDTAENNWDGLSNKQTFSQLKSIYGVGFMGGRNINLVVRKTYVCCSG